MEPSQPPPSHLTGSRGMDILMGMVAAVAWWGLGGLGLPLALTLGRRGFTAMVFPYVHLILLLGFLALIIALARRPGPKTFLITLLITAFGVPLLALLALVGMCSGILR